MHKVQCQILDTRHHKESFYWSIRCAPSPYLYNTTFDLAGSSCNSGSSSRYTSRSGMGVMAAKTTTGMRNTVAVHAMVVSESTMSCAWVSRTRPVWTIRMSTRVEAKQTVVDFPETPYEIVEEDRSEEKVEDAVEDHFLRGRDDVSAFGYTPTNGVEHRYEGNESCTANVA